MGESWLIIILVAVVGFAVIKWASKAMAQILGGVFLLLAIAGSMYVLNLGPFKREVASMDGLRKKFCVEAKTEIKCDCIVDKIEQDLLKRFTNEELQELEENRLQLMYAMVKSFQAKEDEIDKCLEAKNAMHEKEEFVEEVLDSQGILGKAKEFFNGLKDDIDKVDDKYE